MPLFLGIDVGSASVRAAIFTVRGRRIALAVRPIAIHRPQDGFVEQLSENIWKAVCDVTREAVKQSEKPSRDIVSIGFDATCSLVALGDGFSPVSISPSGKHRWNVIVWMDH
ncbi:MAG: FGGY family carbohydrate kinase, partial [Planctomycetota bacterium]